MEDGEKGKIHSNIPPAEAFKVIDTVTRKIIGEVNFPVDDIFVLAGRIWKIVSVEGNLNKIYAKPWGGKAYNPRFRIHNQKGRFFYLLPENIKERIKNQIDLPISGFS